MKYVTTTRVIEAEQYRPGPDRPPEQMPPAHSDVVRHAQIGRWPQKRWRWEVQTIHGDWVGVEPGDYLVLEPDGKHVYPCKAEIFEYRYVPYNAGVKRRRSRPP